MASTSTARTAPLPTAPPAATRVQMSVVDDELEAPPSRSLVAGLGGLGELRWRGQLVPYAVVGLLWAGAAAAHAAPRHGTTAVAVAAAVVAVVAWWAWSRRRTREQRRARRWHAAVTVGGAGMWLMWAAVAGADSWRAVVLWLAAYALALPYWRRHTLPIPQRQPAPVAAVVVDEPEPLIPACWVSRVAVNGGALPGSYLTDQREDRHGWSYTIQLDPVRQTAADAIAATARICAALGRSLDAVVVDRHPSGDLSRARLLVIDNNPLHEAIPYPGPERAWDPVSGYAAIGMHPDDHPAAWGVSVPGWGLCGGVVIGGTGSGKSRLLEGLAATVAHTGIIDVWAGDPQGGSSLPGVIRYASWPATTEDEILRQLRGLARAMDVRTALNGLRGVALHIPTRDEPGILLFIDECHRVFADPAGEAVALATRIAREGRKAAAAIVAASQYPGLETFGGKDPLRSSLMAVNAVVLRVASNTARGMLPGLELNPADLPKFFPNGKPTSGLGYTIGPRTAPMRAFMLDDPAAVMAAAPATPLDRICAAGIGPDYTERTVRRLNARAEAAATLAALDPEVIAAITAEDPELAAALAAYQANPPAAVSAPPAAPEAATRTTTSGSVLTLAPAPRLHLPDEATEALAVLASGTAVDVVYELIKAGVHRKGDLIVQSGYSESHVRNALTVLAEAGRIRRVRHGEYETTAA